MVDFYGNIIGKYLFIILWNICGKYLYRIFLKNICMQLSLPIFLINYTINAGDLDKGNADGNESDNLSHTVGYIVSNDEDMSDFELSDNEPLSKYVTKRSKSPEFTDKPSDAAKPRRRGRPHGKTSAKTPESVSMVKVIQRHVR